MPFKCFAFVALLAAGTAAVGCGGDDSPIAPSPICTYAIAPATSAFPADGGSASVAVTAPASCAWSASAGASWLTITGQSSGSGPASVTYTVSAATTEDARSATLTIAGQTHTVTQQGRAPVICTFDISPATADVGAEETGGTFTVTAPATCAWTAASDSSWLSVTSGSPGTGNGVVSFRVMTNSGAEGRRGVITVGDKTFTVRQNAVAALCQYSVAPVDFNPCMPAGSVSAMVTAPAGCTWTASSNASWLSVVSGASGSGNSAITMQFDENYDAPRDGIVMVRWPTPTAGQNIRIAQAGCTYAVSQNSFAFASAGGTGTFNVIQQSVPSTCGGATQDRCIWSAIADVPWITVSGNMPRAGDDRVSFTVAGNATGAPRTGRIAVRGTIVTINQTP